MAPANRVEGRNQGTFHSLRHDHRAQTRSKHDPNSVAGGMVSDLDVAQAETVLKTAEAQVPDIALQRAKYQNALAVLTGRIASLFQLAERPLNLSPILLPETESEK
ncbi:MAG: hypothetical protein V2B19_17325 [Pseudomonadota bacterium]